MENKLGQNSLKGKTVIGLFWSFADLMANHGMQFLIQIILARLLLPEHFGMIGMIIIFIAVSDAFVDSGFTQALIRDQKTTQEDYSTVFYFNLFISFLMYILLFLLAPIISDFYAEPQLIEIIRVLSISFIIKALGIVQKVILMKKVDFKTLTKVSVISVIFSSTVTLTMAFLGFGVWSIVINMLSFNFFQTIYLWIFNKWLPSLTFKMQSFNKFYKFGYKLLLSGLIDTFYTNVYFIIIGRLFPTNYLGYYTNAVKVRDLASMSIAATLQRVTYPILSSIQDDEERLKFGFKSIIKTAAFINFPLMIGLSAIAESLFIVLLGEKWIPSVIYFQLLCFAGMLYPLHAINLNILQVKGRSDLFLLLEVVKKAVLTILIVLSLLFGLGILGLIWAAIINSFVSLLINATFSAKEVDYSTREQLKDLLPVFILTIVMGLVVHKVGDLLPTGHLLVLVAQVVTGIVFYTGVSKLLKVDELNLIYQLVKPSLKNIKQLINKSQE